MNTTKLLKTIEYLLTMILLLVLGLIFFSWISYKAEAETYNVYESKGQLDTAITPSKRVEVREYKYKTEVKVYELDKYGVQSNPVPEKTIRIERDTYRPTTSLQPSSSHSSHLSTLLAQ